MRRAAIALSVVALAVPAPGFAQSHTASSPSAAVSWTCQQSLIRRGYSEVVAYAACAGDAAAQAVWDEMVAKPFYYMIDFLGIPWPQEASSGGFGGGGGATASYEANCDGLAYKRDASNNLIVPSIPLAGGAPVQAGVGGSHTVVWGNSGIGYAADSKEAGTLYYLHTVNTGRGTDRRKWYGANKKFSNGTYAASSVAHYDPNGSLVGRNSTSIALTFWWYDTPPATMTSCPAESAGGDFHFYLYGYTSGTNFQNCLMYAPNAALSPSGYYYNPETTIPAGSTSGDKADRLAYFDSNPTYADCLLSDELLANVADRFFKRITERAEYDGPPYEPVVPDDVRHHEDPPTFDDIDDETPADPPPSSHTPQTPDPIPSPTPTPTPTGGPDYTDPGIGSPGDPTAPTGLMDPIFDWLPDLPSIEINVAGAACPTWEMQPFAGPEWHLVMDSHCGFIEDNRAAIGALMVVLFTIGAAMIILRA